MGNSKQILNFIDGSWQKSSVAATLSVKNPATTEEIGKVPLSAAAEVGQAADSAAKAFQDWRRTPPSERVQYLFKLKQLLEQNFDEVARTVTQECGKTLQEARGELQRGIENVEVACGIPSLLQGYNS